MEAASPVKDGEVDVWGCGGAGSVLSLEAFGLAVCASLVSTFSDFTPGSLMNQEPQR